MGISVCFSPTSALPEATFVGGSPMADAFAERGLHSTQTAAEWLHALPYGSNERPDPHAVFRDGFGNCTGKHRAFVTLCRELAVAVELTWGFYALTGDIVAGVDEVLARYRLPFIPHVHCFLRVPEPSPERFVDLTEGNCHGKNVQIRDYLTLIDVDPDLDETRGQELRWQTAWALVEALPAFAGRSIEELQEALADCQPLFVAACRADSVSPA